MVINMHHYQSNRDSWASSTNVNSRLTVRVLRLVSEHQEPSNTDVFRKGAATVLFWEMSRDVWSREKKSSNAARLTKVFFSEQSQILHFIWKSRSWSLWCLKSSVKFVRILVAMSSADLGDSWSSVFYQIYSMLRSFIDMLILLSIKN